MPVPRSTSTKTKAASKGSTSKNQQCHHTILHSSHSSHSTANRVHRRISWLLDDHRRWWIFVYQIREHSAIRSQHSGCAETYIEDKAEEGSPGEGRCREDIHGEDRFEEDIRVEDIHGEVDSSRPAAVVLADRSRAPVKAARVNRAAPASKEESLQLRSSATGSAIEMDRKRTVNSGCVSGGGSQCGSQWESEYNTG